MQSYDTHNVFYVSIHEAHVAQTIRVVGHVVRILWPMGSTNFTLARKYPLLERML